MEKDYKDSLEVDLVDSRKIEKTEITPFMQDEWKGFVRVDEVKMMEEVDTAVSNDTLAKVAAAITELPADKKFLRKIEKLIGDRRRMFFDADAMDWAMGELLAYGSLMVVKVTTFAFLGRTWNVEPSPHRHAIVKAEESEEETILLNHIQDEQGRLRIYNSLLSEYGVLGFDYGYAMASPNALTIWEAQFGDFSNGAQIMIDQYISAAEDKWKLQNEIVLLLPHGYEGQGAEHSSARIERYLQLCAKDNMFIANCTTPANMFHLLRRQVKSNYRKPLVVFTPKSLLRHPLVVSPAEDFTSGSFKTLIEDAIVQPAKAKKLVFCSGKFYYDLLKQREESKRDDVALVRLEQLFPFPVEEIRAQLAKYDKVSDVVWAPKSPAIWELGRTCCCTCQKPPISVQRPVVSMAHLPLVVQPVLRKDTKKSLTMSLTKQR